MENTIVKFKKWNCIVEKEKYRNDRIALSLLDSETGENIAMATINMPEVQLEHDEVLIKNNSENEGILSALIEAGIISNTIRLVPTGYVNVHLCKVL